jgi:hypothetical protein
MSVRSLRRAKKRLCPSCFEMVEIDSVFPAEVTEKSVASTVHFYQCSNPACREVIPSRYVRDYGEYPPLVFSLVGFSGHGKTTYLNSLLLEFDRIGSEPAWRGFSWMPIDERRMADAQRKIRELLQQRHVPALTRQVFAEPLIVQLNGVPEVGRCQLLLCDTRGEVFTRVPDTREGAFYAARGEVVVWLLSLFDPIFPDDQDPAHDEQIQPWALGRLDPVSFIGAYAQAAMELNRDPKEQSLLVVLTKADMMIGAVRGSAGEGLPERLRRTRSARRPIPKRVKKYILGDTESWDMGALRHMSRSLERWLENDTPYRNFVRLARKEFRHVRYCVVSSLGASPDKEGKLPIAPAGRGVFAPLLWAGSLQQRAMARARTHRLRRALGKVARFFGIGLLLGGPTALVGALVGGGAWAGLAAIDQLVRMTWSNSGIGLGLSQQGAVGAVWGAGIFGVAGILWAHRKGSTPSPVLPAAFGALRGLVTGSLVCTAVWVAAEAATRFATFSLPDTMLASVAAAFEGAYLGGALGAMWGVARWWTSDRRLYGRWGLFVSLVFGATASQLLATQAASIAVHWSIFAGAGALVFALWIGKYLVLPRPTEDAATMDSEETDE